MQTSTPRLTKARKPTTKAPATKAPAYPEHQASEHTGYFLACLLREQAQYEALCTISAAAGFYRKPQALQDAIFSAQGHTSVEIERSLRYVISDGLLPFAHASTTYFDRQVVA